MALAVNRRRECLLVRARFLFSAQAEPPFSTRFFSSKA